MPPLRIVFMGSDAVALPLLDWLVAKGGGEGVLTAVFTQPDRPSGRGQEVRPNAIKAWALARGLPVHQPEKLGEDERLRLSALRPDVVLVLAYGHLLRDDFIAVPPLGTLNLHASLLPKYRGASPIQTAVACGERETGLSLMRIVRRLDAGPVADCERVGIGPLDTAADVEARLAAAAVPLLARAWPRLAAGTLGFAPQDESAATFCRRLGRPDGALDFTFPAAALAARINGLFPWPACSVELRGQTLRLGLADAPADDTRPDGAEAPPPGVVLGRDSVGLRVQTGTGVLRLRRLQRPGGKMLDADAFLRGFPVAPGERLPSEPLTSLVASSR